MNNIGLSSSREAVAGGAIDDPAPKRLNERPQDEHREDTKDNSAEWIHRAILFEGGKVWRKHPKISERRDVEVRPRQLAINYALTIIRHRSIRPRGAAHAQNDSSDRIDRLFYIDASWPGRRRLRSDRRLRTP